MTSATYSISAMSYQPAFPEPYFEKCSSLDVMRLPEQRDFVAVAQQGDRRGQADDAGADDDNAAHASFRRV